MDYPTEEELAEMQEFGKYKKRNFCKTMQCLTLKYFQGAFMPMPTTQPSQPHQSPAPIDKETPTTNRNAHSFFQNNSQLSQITNNDTAVNRRLFGTPMSTVSNRISSTPFPTHAERNRFTIDEEFENNFPAVDLQPRKRRLDDLFGDIDDIVREENLAQVFYAVDPEEHAKKKARSEEELDKQLITRILNLRAENRAKTSNFLKQSKLQQLEALQKFKQRNLSESFPNWPCIPVVASPTDRIYVRMHSEDFETKQLNDLNFRKTFSNLLGDSSEDIWNAAQSIVEKRLTAPPLAPRNLTDTDEVVFVSETAPNNAGKLWVEKYKPKKYADLLSDESTNRSLLTWLKMWDKIVFNK